MKRLISILVIVAMMLASVLAMIPAYATEGEGEGAGAGDATVTEPITEYSVNWKELLENGTMRSTWIGNRSAGQNNMSSKYNVTATETALKLSQIGNGDSRAYFSEVMFDITADTQYEYVFKADKTNDNCGDAGVIFAWAPNPDTYKKQADHFVDGVDDIYPGVPKGAYHLMANWGSHTSYKVQFGGPDDGSYTQFGTNTKPSLDNVFVDEENFATYKVVYTGLTVEMYYLDTNEQWVEFFEDKEMVLVEGSKIAFGLNTWSPSHTNLKDCVVYAKNDAAVAALNAAFAVDKSEFDAKLAETATFNKADWLIKDWNAFTAKVEEGKAAGAAAETAKYQYVMDYATAKFENAILKLNTTAKNIKPTLEAEIAAVKALAENEATYTETSWKKMADALVAAEAVVAEEAPAQSAMVAAYYALSNARKGLLTIELAAKNAYGVHWQYLVEKTTMKAMWCFDASEVQNNWNSKFTTYATQNSIYAKPIGNGDTRQYYSTDLMVDIADNTYYEYVFSAKNDPNRPTGYAGVVIGWAIDEDAYDEGSGDFNDYTGPKLSSYFLYGAFQNKSDKGDCFHIALDYGYHASNGGYTVGDFADGTGVAKLDEDGYATYKIVYDGYNVTVLYLAADDTFQPVWGDKVATLAEGSKVAFGIFNRSEGRNIYVKDAKLTSYNEAAAENLLAALKATANKIAEAELAKNYTPATEQAVIDALTAVNALTITTPVADMEAAIAAFENAILGLKMADKTALIAAIDAANAAIADKTAADFEERYYTPFAEALAKAIATNDNVNTTQEEADAACAALVNATKYLTPAGAACKVDLVDVLAKYAALVETDYKPSTWAALAEPYATAKALDEAELTNADQDAIDAAVTALNVAIDALAKRADFSKLNAAIKRADALDKNDYTTESWKIDDVLAAAKTAAADLDLDQADVDAAWVALTAAINELVTWKTNVLAIAPADDYVVNDPAKYGDNPTWYNKITDMSYFGVGNVFYYDYFKVVAAKIAEWGDTYEAGKAFPESMESMNWQGDANYVLRLGTNVSGSGTNRVTDGEIPGTAASHRADPTSINGRVYSHVFGFSFVKAPTVDAIAVYLPTDTKIVSIDVYGAVRGTAADGSVIYGKADKDAVVTTDGVKYEEGTANKVYLGTVEIPAATEGADSIKATADFVQAMKVEYVYFAIQFVEGAGVNDWYGIYEIELFGLNDGETVDGKAAPDFSKFNNAYGVYDALVKADYTEDSLAAVQPIIDQYLNGEIANLKGDQAAIDAAGAALEAAVAALVAKPADWTALDEAIAAGAPLAGAAAEYTPKTFAPFKAAYDAAVALRASSNVPQTAVNKATAALTEVFAGLAKRADKTALIPAVEEAKTIVKEAWNGNIVAWNMFEKALNEAIAMLTDDNATQEEVNAKVEALVARRAELKANPGYVPPVDPTPDETDPPKDETDPPKATDDNKATEAPAPEGGCGGCGSSAALSALAIVGVIGTAVVLKKKED